VYNRNCTGIAPVIKSKGDTMPRKKGDKPKTRSPQLVVRIPDLLEKDLLSAADGLGVDLSNLVRMILTEHVGEYSERGRIARERRKSPPPKPTAPPKPAAPPMPTAPPPGRLPPDPEPHQRALDL